MVKKGNTMKHKGLFVLIFITAITALNILHTKQAEAGCYDSAQSALGANYVDTFSSSFNTRCNKGISNQGSYGMIAPVSTNFPESTRSGTFSFAVQRIVYTKDRSGNDWGSCYSNTSYATFEKDKLDCSVSKKGWHVGESMTVWVDSDYLSASGGDEGIIEASIPIETCLLHYRPNSRCVDNTLYFKVYKITNIQHSNSPKATYKGTDYTSTSSTNPISVGDDGSITFTHQLRRDDSWSVPSSPKIKDVYKRKIYSGGTTYSEDGGWGDMTLNAGGAWANVTDSIAISTLGLSPTEPKEVCSRVTHRNVKSLSYNRTAYNDSASNTDSSTICVWVKLNALIAHSESTVMMDDGRTKATAKSDESQTVQTVSIYGGSRKTNYEIDFSHTLKVVGDPAKSAKFSYSVYTSSYNGGWGSAITSGKEPIAGNGSLGIKYSNGTKLNAVKFSLGEGDSKTVCERIYFNPRKVILNASGTNGTESGDGASVVCGTVTRRAPDTIKLTAETNVNHCNFPNEVNPSKIYYNTGATQCVSFQHKFTSAQGQNLSASYTIYYSEDGGKTVASKTTGNVLTDKVSGNTHYKNVVKEHTVSLDYGELKTVCEYVEWTPNTFKLHKKADGSNDGVDAVGGTDKTNWRCIKVGRPVRKYIKDGTFTVYGESSGSLVNPNETGGYYEPKGAYLMKKDEAEVTYAHNLKRNDDRHANDDTKTAEDITAKYRFGTPGLSLDVKYMDTTLGLGSSVVKNDSSSGPFNSNKTDPLFNDNTTARANTVGKIESYCQSIYFYSKEYQMYGEYWMVDGHIWEEQPGMLNAGTPVPYPEDVPGSVGSSVKGCVDVIRPYNFRISTIKTVVGDSASKPPAVGTTIKNTYELVINKNDSEYQITDIPNATIRTIGFVIDGKPDNVAGGVVSADSSLCNFWENKLGIVSSCDDNLKEAVSKNIHPANSSNTGTNYYSGTNQYTYRHTVETEVPNISVDSKFCVAIAVSPSDSGSNGFGFEEDFNSDWIISNATCTNVGKNPNVQIWGSSIFTNGGVKTTFTTSYTDNTSSQKATFGSWTDFMVLANKNIKEMASGAALISGLPTNQDTATATTRLTISNTNKEKPGNADIVNMSSLVEKIHDRYLTSSSNYYRTSVVSAEVLQSEDVRKLSPVIFYNTGDIFITDDITFSRRVFSDTALPQVIVYSEGNIYIDDDVMKVDAWLLAPNGRVNTCANRNGTSLRSSASTCNLRLTVRGPIFSQTVELDRTAGADPYENTAPDPAEVIDLTPAVYLFGANESAQNAQPVTTYMHRLPPRY